MSKILDKKIADIGHTGLLNAVVDQTPYGSYAHTYLAVALRQDSAIGSEKDVAALLEQVKDPLQILHPAMESAATSHELRHFHDCFGTIAGATLFLNHLSLLREFYRALYDLDGANIDVRLPVHDWAGSLDTQRLMRKFSRSCGVNARVRDIFNGAFTIEPQAEGDARPYAELEVFPNKFAPAFPLQIQNGVLSKAEYKAGEITTHWVPLGFDTLVEGNAHALQLAIFDSTWHGIPSAALETAQRIHVSHEDGRGYLHSDAGPLVLPYRISDLLLSKYLRNERNIENFPRRWLLELTDAALMRSTIDEFGPALRAVFPGGIFVSLMEEMKISPDGLNIEIPQTSREAVSIFRGGILSCDPPDNVYDPKSPFSTIEYIARYARHKIIGPMFDMRLKYGNAVFTNLGLYAEKISELPLPPMLLVGGKYRPNVDTDKIFPIVWSKYVMLCEIMGQALRNKNVICCPKAYRLVEGLESFEFAASPGCDAFIHDMACGKWSGVGDQDLPNCEFNKLTRYLFRWKN